MLVLEDRASPASIQPGSLASLASSPSCISLRSVSLLSELLAEQSAAWLTADPGVAALDRSVQELLASTRGIQTPRASLLARLPGHAQLGELGPIIEEQLLESTQIAKDRSTRSRHDTPDQGKVTTNQTASRPPLSPPSSRPAGGGKTGRQEKEDPSSVSSLDRLLQDLCSNNPASNTAGRQEELWLATMRDRVEQLLGEKAAATKQIQELACKVVCKIIKFCDLIMVWCRWWRGRLSAGPPRRPSRPGGTGRGCWRYG